MTATIRIRINKIYLSYLLICFLPENIEFLPVWSCDLQGSPRQHLLPNLEVEWLSTIQFRLEAQVVLNEKHHRETDIVQKETEQILHNLAMTHDRIFIMQH